MRKILKNLRIFGSIILTFVLSILIFIYAAILNIKFVVSANGMANTFKKIDIVETLKSADDGMVWEDFKQLSETLNLSEEQFEQILNSDKVKEQLGGYIGEVINDIFKDEKINLTKEQIEELLNIAVDEYNKVSDMKISDSEREEIVNSIDEEMISDMNSELESVDLTDTVPPKYAKYIEFADKLLFGNYALIMLVAIIVVIGLIALLTFSYYKWMPYVKTSTIISGSLMLIASVLILVVPLKDMEIIKSIRNIVATRMFITVAILFILSIVLAVLKKYLKKYDKTGVDYQKDSKIG